MSIIIAAPAPLTIRARPADPTNYAPTRRTPTIIVLHSTEGREGTGATDDNVAAGIAKPLAKGARKSFHYVVDGDSATRCVPDTLTAWHCGRTGNARGIGVELCGSAKQSTAEWLDATSLATLRIAARLVADLCDAHQIPPVLLTSEDLRAGRSGITTHASVSEAWKESTHWDPGPGFPLADFVEAVAAALAAPPPP